MCLLSVISASYTESTHCPDLGHRAHYLFYDILFRAFPILFIIVLGISL